jgi:YegS/Rv2252/BmrU family lipid kinase
LAACDNEGTRFSRSKASNQEAAPDQYYREGLMLSSQKIVFIVNPRAGNGAAEAKWRSIGRMAEEHLGPFTACFTERTGDATHLTRRHLEAGADLIVAVGGDGTLNEVINGFMEITPPGSHNARLGVMPFGTGCDFARIILKSTSPRRVLQVLQKGDTRSLDLGRLQFMDHHGSPGVRFFHNVVSFGTGGEVVVHVNSHSKAAGAFLSFLRSTLICLLRHGARRIRLHCDGRDEEFVVRNIAVANGRYHGGGMCVAPEARPDDGLLNVTVIGDLSLPEMILNIAKFYNGRIGEVKNVTTMTGRHIEATSVQDIRIDADGEQPGRLPLVIDLLPRALPVIVDNQMFPDLR